MKLKTVSNHVLFRPLVQLEIHKSGLRQQGGILIPDSAVVNPDANQGDNPLMEVSVIAVGPDCKTVKVGDRIIINAKVGARCRVPRPEGGEFGFIVEHQVVAVIEDEPEAVSPVAPGT